MGGRLYDWLQSGLTAARTAAVDVPATLAGPGSVAFYFSTDDKILSIFDESGPTWYEIDAAALAAIAFLTLPDVDPTGLADGQVFRWDNGASKMVPLTLLYNTAEQLQDAVGAMGVNGTGTTFVYDDASGTFKFDSTITQYTDELAQDALAAAFAAGTHTGITITYDDVANKFDFAVTITQYTDELAQDALAAAFAAGSHTGITITYDDATNKFSFASTITQYTDEMAQDAFAALVAAGTVTGLTATYDDALNKWSLAINEASDVEVWTGTAQNKVVTPKSIKDAGTPVSVAYGATITLDFNAGLNFYTTLTGPVTFANPSNTQPGDSGLIHVTQDATGSRVATWGSNWRFPSGAAVGGLLSTSANAVDIVSYYVRADSTISASILRDIKA